MKKMYENLIGLYPVSKTLRFELIPQGKTLENMIENNIIKHDEHRKKSYAKAKKLVDEYHKFFIDESMKDVTLENLEEYYNLYCSDRNKPENKKKFEECEENLRKEIVKKFEKNPKFKELWDRNLITKILPEYYEKANRNEDVKIIKEFSKFVTYFNGFNENRKNIYSFEDKSTSIAYRIVNENLPIFISNMEIYEKIKSNISGNLKLIQKEMSEYIQVNEIDEVFTLEYFNDVLTQKGIELYNLLIGGKNSKGDIKIKGINEYINEYNQKEKIKLPKMKELYKQILSDREKISFSYDNFQDDQEVLDAITDMSKILTEVVLDENKGLVFLIKNLSKYDLIKFI